MRTGETEMLLLMTFSAVPVKSACRKIAVAQSFRVRIDDVMVTCDQGWAGTSIEEVLECSADAYEVA